MGTFGRHRDRDQKVRFGTAMDNLSSSSNPSSEYPHIYELELIELSLKASGSRDWIQGHNCCLRPSIVGP